MKVFFDKIKIELPDKFLEEEIRCGFKVTTTRKKIWAVELDLLNELLRVCKKHDINVVLYAGSILGAIRHKGFIPWDDDIDVALSRKDFEKLKKIAPSEFQYPYFFQSALTDQKYFYGYCRLRNSETTGCITGSTDPDFNNGIYVDIFVLDGYVQDETKLKRQLLYKRLCGSIINSVYHNVESENAWKKLFCKFLKVTLTHLVSYKFFVDLYGNILSMYNKDTNRLSLMTHSNRFFQKYWCEKTSLDKIVYVPFEFMEVPIPSDYHDVLTHMYGKYMEFPPVELRGAWHEGLLQFNPDVSYKDFLSHK